jgi:Mn2+/Fe2+ NRAMP family transporter
MNRLYLLPKKLINPLKQIILVFKRFNISSIGGVGLGAAFLMANSSIGPGFLTQTTVFTKELMASFGFVILVSSFIDIGAQLNTWRILAITEMRAQDLANTLLPGLGYILSFLIVLGGFAFNIGNIAGCGLGVNVLTGLSFEQGAIISGIIALGLFWLQEIGKMLDGFTKILGTLKILLTLFIAWKASPPVATAVYHSFIPAKLSAAAIVTIVGGTVGGYLTFSGAHRLLDAGIKGKDSLPEVNKSAISGIVISGIMRFVLFLATFGVLAQGAILNPTNPPASVFQFAAGELGYRIFGAVLWSAALSSVVGASYTSVSFFKTFHPLFSKYERACISIFIILCTSLFILIGKPIQLLLAAGLINGMVLPLALAIVLIAATKTSIMKNYKHPLWLHISGWLVVFVMGWMAIAAVI